MLLFRALGLGYCVRSLGLKWPEIRKGGGGARKGGGGKKLLLRDALLGLQASLSGE